MTPDEGIVLKDMAKNWKMRAIFDVTLKIPMLWDFFLPSNQLRFEFEFNRSGFDRWRLRNLTQLKFRVWKVDREAFYVLVGDEFFMLEAGVNENRFYTGFQFQLTRSFGFLVYYVWQTQAVKCEKPWINNYIMGLRTQMTF
jgi:hypothetical protein